MDEKRARELLGSPERRIATGPIEIRAGSGSTFKVRGYASVVEHAYDVYGGPPYGWDETVGRGAFDVTLAAKPDVVFLCNHEGMPLARCRNGAGTLTLHADNTGLESEAEVDRRDPFGQALEVKMERGDLDQMSFGFRVTRQEWNEDYTERRIVEVNLDKGDVSIVNTPANPATSMSIVSARSAVAVLREMELAELRSELRDITPAEIRAAQDRLGALASQLDAAVDETAAGAVTVDLVPVLRDLSDADVEHLRGLLLPSAEDAEAAQLVPLVRQLVDVLLTRAAKPADEALPLKHGMALSEAVRLSTTAA